MNSLDFTYKGMCVKLFISSDVELIKECQNYLCTGLTAVKEKCHKFISKYDSSVNRAYVLSVFCDCT